MGFPARVLAALVTLGGIVTAATSGSGCAPADKETIASPCPPGQRCEVNLTVLHTSDIHSRLFPYDQVITQVDATLGLGEIGSVANIGGVARMAYVLNRERARSGRVIHVDSGDCFQGAPIFNYFSGEPEMRALSAMGMDAAVLGNHDFDRGAQNLATQIQRWSNFATLAANYKFDQTTQDTPNYGRVGTVSRPFVVLNSGGLKIAVIGMANLSSFTSIFDQPNKSGITPLNSIEVAQFYTDLLRPYVDIIAITSHMGLDVDQRYVRGTTGIDVVFGGHNHVVINPPQEIRDCSADPNNPGYVWASDPNLVIDPNVPPPDGPDRDPRNHPWAFKRACKPRRVHIVHSGAFAKYVGRLDMVVTNRPELASPTADPADYDPVNGFEVLSTRYQAFPIDAKTPEDPVLVDMLQPYKRSLDNAADLDILVGYSPQGSRRFATTGGDSPLGNVVGNAIWLRLGIQTDFSMTNSTGIRTDLNPGPVTIEQMFNIFPFDNSISKMQLSGSEVQQLFDFAARRSANRGCSSQIQIAGARVRLNCTTCPSQTDITCANDNDCSAVNGRCNFGANPPVCQASACAENVYIGHTEKRCFADEECSEPGKLLKGSCDKTGALPGICRSNAGKRCSLDSDCAAGGPITAGDCDTSKPVQGLCLSPIKDTNLYELATSNYLAGGGSGFRVLQRNTTQVDTKVQQRDALIDYLRAGRPCGFDPAAGTSEGLKACSTDADCGNPSLVCTCPGHVAEDTSKGFDCQSVGNCDAGNGRCVLRDCRNQVAQFHLRRCEGVPDIPACKTPVNACQLGGEQCKILSCIDAGLGSRTDNRVEMIGR